MDKAPPIGARVRANEFFFTQFTGARPPREGTVVGYPRFGRAVRVKWDTLKIPQALHVDYVELLTCYQKGVRLCLTAANT